MYLDKINETLQDKTNDINKFDINANWIRIKKYFQESETIPCVLI